MINPYFLGEVDDLGHDVHLFLDDFAIEDRWDAKREQNEPIKHPNNPVLIADQPWETLVFRASVLYDTDARLFRMWYDPGGNAAWTRDSSGMERSSRDYGPYKMAYAESDDGVTWRKPKTDRFPYLQWDHTNIVFTGQGRVAGFKVKETPQQLASYGRFMCSYKDDSHERRYEQQDLNDFIAPGHTCLAFSDDGIDWRPYEGNPLCPCLDTVQDLHWNERIGMWILVSGRPFARAATEDLYRKVGAAVKGGQAQTWAGGLASAAQLPGAEHLAGVGRAGAVENVRTRIAVSLSPDLKIWYPPRDVLLPDAQDDAEQMFFDHMPAHRCGSQYLGFLGVQPRDADGKGWIELTGSPDGLHWYRPRERKPFLAPGVQDSWDAGHVWMLMDAVPYGEWLYMYYTGSSRPWRTRYPDNTRAIGLARIRRDRFVGYNGNENGGHLISREVKVAGPQLLVNCTSQHKPGSDYRYGSLQTELVERTGRAIDGYTYADCDTNLVDDIAVPITWGGKDLSALMGRKVHIRFFMRNMFVFSFRFAPAVGEGK